MNTEYIIPKNKMILIGATGRNSGKTTLSTKIIKQFKDKIPIIAFKLITVRDHSDVCPRGGQGCGICKGLEGNFDIREELGDGSKDTMLLKQAGAKHVYLIRSLKDNLKEAFTQALTLVPDNALIICESNSARLVVEPSCFVMINSSTSGNIKPTAKAVMSLADIVLDQDEEAFNEFLHSKLPLLLLPKKLKN